MVPPLYSAYRPYIFGFDLWTGFAQKFPDNGGSGGRASSQIFFILRERVVALSRVLCDILSGVFGFYRCDQDFVRPEIGSCPS